LKTIWSVCGIPCAFTIRRQAPNSSIHRPPAWAPLPTSCRRASGIELNSVYKIFYGLPNNLNIFNQNKNEQNEKWENQNHDATKQLQVHNPSIRCK
jgi:hypothetical protein